MRTFLSIHLFLYGILCISQLNQLQPHTLTNITSNEDQYLGRARVATQIFITIRTVFVLGIVLLPAVNNSIIERILTWITVVAHSFAGIGLIIFESNKMKLDPSSLMHPVMLSAQVGILVGGIAELVTVYHKCVKKSLPVITGRLVQ